MLNKFSILNGAKCFPWGIFQNCLVFIAAKKCIKYFSGITQIGSCKSNGMSEKLNQIAVLHQLLMIIVSCQIKILMDTV